MLCRLSNLSRCSRGVRKLSMFDSLLNDPLMKDKAAEMLKNPESMNKAMSSFSSMMKDGGGGITGMLLRNGPLKGAIEKLGGIENVEKMMKDPQMMEMVQKMMNDPAMMAKAQSSMAELMSKKDEEKKP